MMFHNGPRSQFTVDFSVILIFINQIILCQPHVFSRLISQWLSKKDTSLYDHAIPKLHIHIIYKYKVCFSVQYWKSPGYAQAQYSSIYLDKQTQHFKLKSPRLPYSC